MVKFKIEYEDNLNFYFSNVDHIKRFHEPKELIFHAISFEESKDTLNEKVFSKDIRQIYSKNYDYYNKHYKIRLQKMSPLLDEF